MNTENDLIQRLMVSKKIMERHDQMERGKTPNASFSSPMVEEYQPINATYNLPKDLLEEQPIISRPTQNTYNNTADKIANSKLPDEIKKLMLEHPIEKPNMGMAGPTLSNELVDKAARLMSVDASGKQVSDVPRRKSIIEESSSSSKETLKEMIREVIEDVLHENGLLIESETKSNDIFKFRVGDHIFEGKVTKIKKVSK